MGKVLQMISNKKHYEHCPSCDKPVFFNDNYTMWFEDYNKTIIHDQFKCYNFKHYKKQFEKIEDSLQTLIQEVKQIQELLF